MSWQFRFHHLAKEDYKAAYGGTKNSNLVWANVLEKP